MDSLDLEMVQQWRANARVNWQLLADIAAGRTKRAYSASEIAGLEAEAKRLDLLAENYEAQIRAQS